MKRRLVKLVAFLLLGAIVNVAVAWGCAAFIDINQAAQIEGRVGADNPTWFIKYRKAFGSLNIGPRLLAQESRGIAGAFEVLSKRFRADVTPEIPSWSTLHQSIPSDAVTWPPNIQLNEARMPEEARGWPLLSFRCAFDEQTICWRNNLPPLSADSMRYGSSVQFVPRGFTKEVTINPPAGSGVIGGWFVSAKRASRGLLEVRAIPYHPIWPGFAINTVFYAALLWLMFAAPFALRRSIRRRRCLCPACAYPVGTNDVCTECGKTVRTHKAETQKAETQKPQTT